MMYYQWPGSVNLTKLGMKLQSSNDTVSNTSLAAIKGGVFLRSPVSWIGEWNTIMDKAWVKIIESGGVTSYTQIPSLMTHYNQEMYNYLVEFYSQSVANNYEAGVYAPVEGS